MSSYFKIKSVKLPEDFPERLVVVDDDPDMRALVRECVKSQRPEQMIVTCGSGAELISRYRELRPDLVLLDLIMPGMNGPDTIEKLRTMPEAEGLPIIFLTGKKAIEMQDLYNKLDVQGVIYKPFGGPQEFVEKISECWRKFQKSD